MAACDAVAAFGANEELNQHLFKRGVLPILIEYLFEYDYTLEEGGVERDIASNKQEQKNKLAKQAIHAIAVLSGLLSGQTPNVEIRRCIEALMTPHLTSLMSKAEYKIV